MLMKTDWQKSMFFFIEYYDFSTILGMCSLNNSPPSNRVPIFRGNYKPGKSTNFKINYQYLFYFTLKEYLLNHYFLCPFVNVCLIGL